MKIVVLYDSVFGNTKLVAEAIAESLKSMDAKAISVTEFKAEDIEGAEAMIIGSPTRAFNPTPAMNGVLKTLPSLSGKRVMVFDTRSDKEDLDSKAFNFFEKYFGYAAEKMTKALKKKGAAISSEYAGFFVTDAEGPLKEGELERAKAWAQKIIK